MAQPPDLVPRVLYRDDDVIVLDKPAGIAVHAGSGRADSLDLGFAGLRFGRPDIPQLAHRLDRETSGCLVLGRHGRALARLGRQFQAGTVKKTYWAVVAGVPEPREGRCEQALARRGHDRRSWVMRTADPGDREAKAAVTRYRVLAAGDGLSLIQFEPQTGRTHQIRVHSAALGCPIAGDALYGGDRARALARQLQLHARQIVLPSREGVAAVKVTAPLPDHMRALVGLIGLDPDAIVAEPQA